MKNNEKKIPTIILSILFLLLIQGCDSSEETTSNPMKVVASDLDTETVQVAQEGYLVVNSSKCVGCGHCVKFAPENFEMQGRVAVVTSQENIESASVVKAKDRCKGDAITI